MNTSPRAVSRMAQAEFAKWNHEETAKELNRLYNVKESVDWLKGFHLVGAELWKPGVYRIMISRWTSKGAEFQHGFASQQIITTARELGYLSDPNGYTLP